MNYITLFGAGRSSIYLIEYLQSWCINNQYKIKIGDVNCDYAIKHLKNHTQLEFINININDLQHVEEIIGNSRLIVSLLPPSLHLTIANICINKKIHLATASYVSEGMKKLNDEAKKNDLIFLNEIGLDPGIDHMSAMAIFDELKNKGAQITEFESYCGGLIANECDGENPWKYKFSWNPSNVVLAGQGGIAKFLLNNEIKLTPYHHLFKQSQKIDIDGNVYETYANRDSLSYIEQYGLNNVKTMIRGTLRKNGYCSAWQLLVNLGLTDNTTVIDLPIESKAIEWLKMYITDSGENIEKTLKEKYNASESDIEKIKWLGLLSEIKLPITKGTSAQLLEEVLKSKWTLEENDRDLIVMIHKIKYELGNESKEITSTLELEGENKIHTAMAKTVGLPLAIACKLILENKIKQRGVLIPTDKEIYEPVLEELKKYGIVFNEYEKLT